MRRTIKAIAFSLCVTSAIAAHGQSLTNFSDDFKQARDEGVSSVLLDIDNDSLLFNRKDGFYTSGIRLSQKYTLRDQTSSTAFGWRIGQDLYTASDIKLLPSQIAPNDHPYAGWLYGGVFSESDRVDGTHQLFGVDIGCLGPCAGGEATQKGLHHLISQPQPQGWSMQMKDEWGVVLYADIAPVRWKLGDAVDLTPSIGGRFGNIHTDVNAGLTLRAGQLNQLPDQSTLHGFLRVNGRAVAYDATLQGGYFSSDNPRTVDPRRLVGEAEAGLVWQREQNGLQASIIRRGNEISGLSDAVGAQNFVRLQFIYIP
jgi:hypothetical protein